MTHRMFVIFGVLVPMFVVLTAIHARMYWVEQRSDELISAVVAPVLPPEGAPTDADRAVSEVLAAAGSAGELRVKAVALLTPAIELPGTGTLLDRAHDIKPFRKAMKGLASEVRVAFALGRTDEALKLVEAADRLARIYGRGFVNTPLVIVKMAASGAQADLDREVEAALRAGAVPAGELKRLDAIYADVLAREVGLDPAVTSELALIERCVRTFDRQRGVLRYLDTDRAADGVAQVRAAREDWAAGRAAGRAIDLDDPHFVVAKMLPNLDAARASHGSRLKLRQSVRAAIAAQRSVKV